MRISNTRIINVIRTWKQLRVQYFRKHFPFGHDTLNVRFYFIYMYVPRGCALFVLCNHTERVYNERDNRRRDFKAYVYFTRSSCREKCTKRAVSRVHCRARE